MPTAMSSESHSTMPSTLLITISLPEPRNMIGNDGMKIKHSEKDDSNEDVNMAKKPMRAVKSSQPEDRTIDVQKRKRHQTDELALDLDLLKKPKLTNRSLDFESEVPEGIKRKFDQDVDSTGDLQPAKKPRLTKEMLQCQLKAAKNELESTEDQLKSTNNELQLIKRKLENAQVEILILEEQLGKAAIKFMSWDTTVEYHFIGLDHAIIHFGHEHLVSPFEAKTLPENIEKKFEEVSKEGIRMAFRLHRDLREPFQAMGEDDGLGLGLGRFYSGEVGGSSEDLDRWRSYTAQILYNCPMNAAKIQGLKDELLELTQPFFIKQKECEIETEIKPAIDAIFKEAIEMALIMNRMDRQFEFMRKDLSIPDDVPRVFDNRWMRVEAHALVDDDVVDLIISPCLLMYIRNPVYKTERVNIVRRAAVCYKKGVWSMDPEKCRGQQFRKTDLFESTVFKKAKEEANNSQK
ncbi:uncharacterized protein F4817DRAFT_318221 [Daldinia loculata]|uniref:uncharacterized protein n=1 Tax=Daldinia loculata TaxID=103429 RepID=UPI0020C47F4D|nr:uncharacterized protein F4817DRAFT_318221 [Daldinia loculata]KAI1645104.1 hypothetical protein F4817DRAFT_318221 [Daldinia loculata]